MCIHIICIHTYIYVYICVCTTYIVIRVSQLGKFPCWKKKITSIYGAYRTTKRRTGDTIPSGTRPCDGPAFGTRPCDGPTFQIKPTSQFKACIFV